MAEQTVCFITVRITIAYKKIASEAAFAIGGMTPICITQNRIDSDVAARVEPCKQRMEVLSAYLKSVVVDE